MENPNSKLSPRSPKSKRQLITNPARNWLELPPEVMANILHRLGAIEILESAQKVCTTWRKICKDPAMWRVIDMWNLGDLHAMPYDLDKMCKHAVDRSEGQLIDINIEYFGTEELLYYIADRSSRLRRVQISCCYGSFYEGLGAAIKKLPLLEELHLNLTDIAKEDIQDVGRFCPRLKSFKLSTRWYKFSEIEDLSTEGFDRDAEALAIAKSMPQLRHLLLIGNQITDKGLKAILDGCPHLESLDLRLCNNLKLEGGLGERCSEQIKDLKRPSDSTKGCEFAFVDSDGYDHHCGIALHYDDNDDNNDEEDDDDDGDTDDDDDDDGDSDDDDDEDKDDDGDE